MNTAGTQHILGKHFKWSACHQMSVRGRSIKWPYLLYQRRLQDRRGGRGRQQGQQNLKENAAIEDDNAFTFKLTELEIRALIFQ